MSARCAWVGDDPLHRTYHDREWGVPSRDDRHLFEMLVLETFQAGLSWLTVLRKREAFRAALAGFDPERVATYGEAELAALLQERGIIRNRAKLEATVTNARCFLALQERCGTFAGHLWAFVGGAPVVGAWREAAQVPARTPLSQSISRDLKRRGFRFVGPVVAYSYLQACGLVMDHTTDCFRYAELASGR